MRNFDLRDLQLKELEILKEVDRICRLHNIDYSLAYGSAIGAIRHQGFIPWDDDVDIFMTFENLKKFKAICKTEMKEQYFIQDFESEPSINFQWTKVRDTNTTSIFNPMKDFPIHWGVCIDIFILIPIEGSSLNKLEAFLDKVIKVCINIEANKYGYGTYSYENKKIKYIPKFLARMILKISWKLMTRKRKNPTHYYDMEGFPDYIYPMSCFESYLDVSFENVMLKINEGYDEVMRQYYGDYMKIPEAHEQVDHGDIIVDVHKSYKEYL